MCSENQPSPMRLTTCLACNGQGGYQEEVRAMQGHVIDTEWQPCLLCASSGEVLVCADLTVQHPYNVCSREEN